MVHLVSHAYADCKALGNKSKTYEVKDIILKFLKEERSLQVVLSPEGSTSLIITSRTQAIEAMGCMFFLNCFVFYPSTSAL
jgi:hypothetical protein